MKSAQNRLLVLVAMLVLTLTGALPLGAQQAAAGNRVLGTVESISGNEVAVRTDAGTTTKVTVSDSARILRTAPGQKTLAGAAKIAVNEIEPGDRVLMMVAGDPPAASVVVVNKKGDLEARQQQEEADWQKRGSGGIVKSVDAQAGAVIVAAGSRTITIHITPMTLIRRYAPDSVKFSDAQPSTLAAIQPGDQVTARGDKPADGSEITAEEIVSGSFRNIAGMVVAADATAGTFTVKDLITKKTVTIRTTPDSDMRKLDPQTAQTIAMRLKADGGRQAAGNGGPHEAGEHATAGGAAAGAGQAGQGMHGGSGSGNGRSGLAQVLQRSPEIHVSDLHKGDAVMIVAASGSPDSATVIHLVSGVEPMLQASASGSQSMFSSAWNLGGGSAGGDDSGGGSNP